MWISEIDSYVPLDSSIQFLITAISLKDYKREDLWLEYMCEYFRYFLSQYQSAFGELEKNEMEMILRYALTAGVEKAYLRGAARVWAEIKGIVLT